MNKKGYQDFFKIYFYLLVCFVYVSRGVRIIVEKIWNLYYVMCLFILNYVMKNGDYFFY